MKNQVFETVLEPRLMVEKASRRLKLFDGGRLAAEFFIALGFCPVGPKEREGDGKTPEGEYYICVRNPKSRFYKSLGLSYPSLPDAEKGLMRGQIGHDTYGSIAACLAAGKRPPWDTPLGGEIFIHGHGTAGDWTAGCIAVEDEVMDILWAVCPSGTPVTILP